MSDLPPKEYGLGGRNYAKTRDAQQKVDEAKAWEDANTTPPAGGRRIFPPGDPEPLSSRQQQRSQMTLTPDEAMRQARMTAHDYMLHAKHDIAEIFNQEAVDKPELIAAYMNAAALDFLAWQVGQLVDAAELIAAGAIDISPRE